MVVQLDLEDYFLASSKSCSSFGTLFGREGVGLLLSIIIVVAPYFHFFLFFHLFL
jgi:hypothetical protein